MVYPPTDKPADEGTLQAQLENKKAEKIPAHHRRGRSRSRERIENHMDEIDQQDLDHLLSTISITRKSICKIMVFCLDHAKYANDICHIICKPLLDGGTLPHPIKAVALFYLLNDLLHNSCSGAANAWSYRNQIERMLPEIAEMIGSVAERADEMESKKVKDAVLNVFDSWDRVSLFGNTFLKGLESACIRSDKGWQRYTPNSSNDYSPYLNAKIKDWSQQHFSSLEKLCRMRGLRSSTEHVGSDANTRANWLIERLINYELFMIENGHISEETPVLTIGKSLIKKEKKREEEDLDGQEMGSDIDGDALSGSDLDELPEDLFNLDGWSTKNDDIDGVAMDIDGVEISPTVVKSVVASADEVQLQK